MSPADLVRLARRALALWLCVSLVGCATLMASGPDHVPVATNPPGAFVYVDRVYVGRTPTVIALGRDQPAEIQIYLPGFEPIVMKRDKRLNGWFVGSIFLVWLILPVIIDLATGNFRRHERGPILLGLTPRPGSTPPRWYQPQPQQQPAPPQPPVPQPYTPPPTAQPPVVQPPNAPPPPE